MSFAQSKECMELRIVYILLKNVISIEIHHSFFIWNKFTFYFVKPRHSRHILTYNPDYIVCKIFPRLSRNSPKHLKRNVKITIENLAIKNQQNNPFDYSREVY